MKKLAIFLFVICLITQTASAADPVTDKAVDAGSSMVKSGINSWIKGIADNMYEAGDAFDNTTTSSSDHSFKQILNSMIVASYDPFEDQWVLSTRNMTAFIFLFLVLIYIFTGGAYVFLHTISPQTGINLDWIGGFDYRSFSFKHYLSNLISGLLILVGSYTIVRLILYLNQALTAMVSITVLDSIAPNSDNSIVYFGMAMIYFGLAVFMAWRVLVIGLMCAFVLVLGGLYLFDIGRGISTRVFYYYCMIVFMQFILVSIAGGGVMIIQNLPTVKNIFVFYLALGQMLFFVALILVLGPVWIGKLMKGAVKTISVVI